MLLAVDGGDFFSSSASGYSKGLMLLLLGRGKEERPMRIAPCSQYQLVEQEGNLDHQLATKKGETSCGCASFMCFHRASAGVDGPSPPKVGPVNHSETFQRSSLAAGAAVAADQGKFCKDKDTIDKSDRKVCIKSSLKKPSIATDGDCVPGSMEGGENSMVSCSGRRKVQWTDSCGRELAEIREFEPSDDDTSDDDFERDFNNRCQCVIQ